MKNKYLFLTVLSIGLLAVSCVRKPDAVPDPTLDLNFKFQTRSEMTVSVSAINEHGQPSPGTLFSIYAGDPSEVPPIYRGYTEADGTVTVSLSVPNSAELLYIVPDYAGYGPIVTAGLDNAKVSVELKGTQFTETKASMKATAESDIERERIACGTNFHFYTSYLSGSDYDPDYGVMNMGSELVSEDFLSNEFKDLVTLLFPESNNNYDSNLANDIIINEDGTQVWLTFISDGGYTNTTYNNNVLNSVMYFTYNDESELPNINSQAALRDYFKSSECNLSYAFLNIHPSHIATGTKVQLLYWNGTKYVQEFPAGTKIGFALVLDGYRKEDGTRTFNLKPEKIVFSDPDMNYMNHGLARSIIFREPDFNCCVMGMEFGFGSDTDYNDALIKITTSRNIGITNEPVPPVEETEISSTQQGTLAFEDLWPYIGDYDFNDFVTDYKYEFNKVKGTNNISSIKITFSPRAIGAGENNGFGIEFPLTASAVSAEGASIENGTDNATVIVFENTRSAFGGISGEINTSPNLPYIEGTPFSFTVKFASHIAESMIPVSSLNPFLFKSDNRAKEIHLVDHAPTSKADLSLLGTAYDKSYAPDGTYYRMDNKYPWALDIASTGNNTWRYPVERVNITSAYLNYDKWVIDHNGNWFDWTVPGNAAETNLY